MNNLAAAIQWNFFHSFIFTHDHVLQSQLVRESKRNCRVLSQMSLFVCECRLEKNFHKTDQRMYIACGCQLEKLILKCASASKQFLLLWFQFQYHDYFRFLLVFVMRFFIEYFRLWVIFNPDYSLQTDKDFIWLSLVVFCLDLFLVSWSHPSSYFTHPLQMGWESTVLTIMF